jgi:hypothetical protein
LPASERTPGIGPYGILTGATGADQFQAVVALAIAASCGFPATPGTYADIFAPTKRIFYLTTIMLEPLPASLIEGVF